ncbi:MAG: hypothetical protein ACTTH6_01480 [Candidatus Altimarinota bacterium]
MTTPKITDSQEKMSATVGAIIFFAPHFMAKKTEFVTFYMKQSFGLVLVDIILGILAILPVIGLIFSLASLLVVVVMLVCAYKAYFGEKFEIPQLMQYVDKLIEKVSFLKPLFTPKN